MGWVEIKCGRKTYSAYVSGHFENPVTKEVLNHEEMSEAQKDKYGFFAFDALARAQGYVKCETRMPPA